MRAVLSAFLGHFDFIYALPGAWLSVPFTFLGKSTFWALNISLINATIGIIAEAGSSVTFRNRSKLSCSRLANV